MKKNKKKNRSKNRVINEGYERCKKKIVIQSRDHLLTSIRLRKSKPRKCSTPRQLCLQCFAVIHKLDSNYKKKICKKCEISASCAEDTGDYAPRTPRCGRVIQTRSASKRKL